MANFRFALTKFSVRPITPSMQVADLEELVSVRGQPAGGRSRRRLIVRRALFAADMVALLTAFVCAAEAGPGDQTLSRFGLHVLAFVPVLPVWAIGAMGMGLYDRDEQRPDHSTVDDFSRVLQLATIVSWCVLGTTSFVSMHHQVRAAFFFWLCSVVAVLAFRVDRTLHDPASPGLPRRTRSSSARARSASSSARKLAPAPRVRDPRRRLRRLRAEDDARRLCEPAGPRTLRRHARASSERIASSA